MTLRRFLGLHRNKPDPRRDAIFGPDGRSIFQPPRTPERTAAAIQAKADHVPDATELERAALQAALTDLVRAIETAPQRTWASAEQVRALGQSQTLIVDAPHLRWRPLRDALVKAKALLGERHG